MFMPNLFADADLSQIGFMDSCPEPRPAEVATASVQQKVPSAGVSFLSIARLAALPPELARFNMVSSVQQLTLGATAMHYKPKFAGAVLASAMIICAANNAARADLVTNGGFETGDLTGWTCSTSTLGACTVETADFIGPHSGSFLVNVFNNGPNPVFGTLSQTITTTPGDTYELSVWSAKNLSNPVLEYQIGSGTAVTMAPGLGAYSDTIVDFVASSSSTPIAFLFATQLGFGSIVIDDVSVVETAGATPLPAALPLFASGLGALGLLGWRRKRKSRASLLGTD
jgi:hypothetical protein